jgi:hypothetical protein
MIKTKTGSYEKSWDVFLGIAEEYWISDPEMGEYQGCCLKR